LEGPILDRQWAGKEGVEAAGDILPAPGASLLEQGVRTKTEAISCECAAYGHAVAVEPLESWVLHQWELKGPPIPKTWL
jgi:hypothetical protein